MSGHHYFSGAQSKGLATLRNVQKWLFLGQDWAHEVRRFSVLVGFFTRLERNSLRRLEITSSSHLFEEEITIISGLPEV